MPPRFPFTAARDLVGILRALYAAERAQHRPSSKRLAQIAAIAAELKDAIRMAAPHDPGTAPYERAVAMAEAAAGRLADVLADRVGGAPSLERVVETAGRRVRGAWKPSQPTEREQRWAVGKKRN